ncbi:hypothetical protein CRUP_023937 [Coryphaenoides rupestris]|nr:hypothetical protein CRUP_023937 [Coryphaenoides rupestris]
MACWRDTDRDITAFSPAAPWILLAAGWYLLSARMGRSSSPAAAHPVSAECRFPRGRVEPGRGRGEAFIPYYTGKAIDGIVVHQSMEYFTKPLLTVAVLALASSFAIGIRGGVFWLTFSRLNLRLRNLLFRSLLRQEIGFFDANHTGN